MLEKVVDLMREKKELEEEIEQLQKELKGMGAGMSGSMVDKDGFPRSDVDVHGVMHLRNKIIRKYILVNHFESFERESRLDCVYAYIT